MLLSTHSAPSLPLFLITLDLTNSWQGPSGPFARLGPHNPLNEAPWEQGQCWCHSPLRSSGGSFPTPGKHKTDLGENNAAQEKQQTLRPALSHRVRLQLQALCRDPPLLAPAGFIALLLMSSPALGLGRCCMLKTEGEPGECQQ